MRNKTFISSMVGVAAAVAVAGSANAGLVDNFTRSLANTSPNDSTSLVVVDPLPGAFKNRSNSGLTGTVFPRRYTNVSSEGSSATMTGNGSAAFVLGRATGAGSGDLNADSWGSMFINYLYSFNLDTFVDLTGTTNFSINVGSYTGGATNWNLAVSMGGEAGISKQILTNSNIVNGVLTFNVANMTSQGTINWAQVDSIGLTVTRDGWGTAGTTVGFTLSDFQYNAIPAPGALALLGAAGIVGARRRRA